MQSIAKLKSLFQNYRVLVKIIKPQRILSAENELKLPSNSRLIDLETNLEAKNQYDSRIVIFGYDEKVRDKLNEKSSIFGSTLFRIAFYSSLVGKTETFAQVLPEQKTIVAAVPIDEFSSATTQQEITTLTKASDLNRSVRQALCLAKKNKYSTPIIQFIFNDSKSESDAPLPEWACETICDATFNSPQSLYPALLCDKSNSLVIQNSIFQRIWKYRIKKIVASLIIAYVVWGIGIKLLYILVVLISVLFLGLVTLIPNLMDDEHLTENEVYKPYYYFINQYSKILCNLFEHMERETRLPTTTTTTVSTNVE